MADVVELLTKTKLFGSLGVETLAQIAKQMRPVKFDSGQLIFERGDPGDRKSVV